MYEVLAQWPAHSKRSTNVSCHNNEGHWLRIRKNPLLHQDKTQTYWVLPRVRSALGAVLVSYCCCTNHKFSSFKWHDFIISQFCRSEVWHGSSWPKSKCQQSCEPSGCSEGKSISFPFLMSSGPLHWPWLMTPFSLFKHIIPISASMDYLFSHAASLPTSRSLPLTLLSPA